MIRRILLMLTLLCSAAAWSQSDDAKEAVTAIKCFSVAPMRIIPYLDKNTRLDMIDYFEAGSDKESENVYGGPCRLLSSGPASLVFQAGNGIECALFVLNPEADAFFVGVIETLETPIPDSAVKLYNRYWQRVGIDKPRLADWLVKGADKKAARELPMVFASCVFDPEKQQLVYTNTTREYYVEDDMPAAVALLKPQIVYQWTGKKFKLMK